MPPRGHARYTTPCLPTPSTILPPIFSVRFYLRYAAEESRRADFLPREIRERCTTTRTTLSPHPPRSNHPLSSLSSLLIPPAPFPSSFFLRTHMFAERTHYFRASSFRFLLIVKPIGWDKKEMIRGNERIGDVDQERERFHRRKYTIYVQIYIISHTYHG